MESLQVKRENLFGLTAMEQRRTCPGDAETLYCVPCGASHRPNGTVTYPTTLSLHVGKPELLGEEI